MLLFEKVFGNVCLWWDESRFLYVQICVIMVCYDCNPLIEKENHLPNLHFWQHVNLRCIFFAGYKHAGSKGSMGDICSCEKKQVIRGAHFGQNNQDQRLYSVG